jgi:lysosomal alpha-mannosidase
MHMQMGYDGLFFWRNDYDDRNNRLKDNLMEMVWRPSPSLGPKSDLFTGILFYGYGPPPGFCYDMKCADSPIQVTIGE